MISLFSFLHTGTAFMVIVQFRGRLVQQYKACVVDSLGLGISQYYAYKASQSCLLCFLCHPYIPHYNLAGRQGIEFIHVSSFVFHSVFLCQLATCTYMPPL